MDAVCRHQAHPEIPWSSIIAPRNIVMQAWGHFRPELLRDMPENEVPEWPAHCLRLLHEH